MLNLAAVTTVFGLTFLASTLPDKSLFASLLLGTRYRPLYVWAGVAAASWCRWRWRSPLARFW